MVKFSSFGMEFFDASKYFPPRKLTPEEYARYQWWKYQFDHEEDDLDFPIACKMASYDLEVYNAVKDWAWAQDVDALPEWAQAALGRVLGRKPPRKGTAATARRDAYLRAIAAQLVEEYRLPLTRGEHSATLSASAILSTLPGMEMVSERTIANLLTGSQK